MNTANKLTISRIILAILIILLLLFDFTEIGLAIPIYYINDKISISLVYLIVLFVFILASATDFLDGYIARKKNQVSDLGKMLDPIADKVLVNSLLIILAAKRELSPIIPIVIVARDAIVDALKMYLASKGEVIGAIKTAKIKTFSLCVGLGFFLMGDLPFSLMSVPISKILLFFGTFMSLVSMLEYIDIFKKVYKNKSEK